MKLFSHSVHQGSVQWGGMIDGADSVSAVATAATVAMPDVARAPERAAEIPDSFLASGQASEQQKRPVRDTGRGR